MTAVGWLPAPTEELFGPEATAEESYELLTVDVPPTTWLSALRTARDDLGCTYFDWLSAVDEPGTGFRVSAHVVALSPVRRLLVRTTVPHENPALPTAVDVYAGAAWHERETHEMFGVDFEGHPALDHLLLPETFEGHPLRKDFVLAARVAKAWPGAKEPGESDHGGPKRRQMLPPGVPDPNEWGPLKGQLPPAPTRPTRAAGGRPPRAVEGDRPARAAAGDRPVRRARTASEGSASQTPPAGGEAPQPQPQTGSEVPPTEGAPARPRRSRSASEGSASQQPPALAQAPVSAQAPTPAPGPAAEPAPPADPASAPAPAPAPEGTPAQPPTPPRSADAPWHHARPAFDEPASEPAPQPEPDSTTRPAGGESSEADSTPEKPAREDPAPEDPTPDTPAGGSQ
ncbi:NADH-quinone oxidoreductase subunit C [Streptomyces sp. NPDC005492]|uniref:NADH-quinone oxidoreductase subunit C n=1 Tax=Streptomyces sp. NPDC005492 TaxID=3156883 RepID=UPI0033A1D909